VTAVVHELRAQDFVHEVNQQIVVHRAGLVDERDVDAVAANRVDRVARVGRADLEGRA